MHSCLVMEPNTPADKHERVSISMCFQIGTNGCVLKRKRLVNVAGNETVNSLLKIISGLKGGSPLWPRTFPQGLEANGVIFALTTKNPQPMEAESDSWHLCAPWTRISALNAVGSRPGLLLLFRLCLESEISDPLTGFFGLDATSSARDLKARRKWFKQYPQLQLKSSFLHVTEQAEDPTVCSRSDPGSRNDDDMAAADEALDHHRALRINRNKTVERSIETEEAVLESVSRSDSTRVESCTDETIAESSAKPTVFTPTCASEGSTTGSVRTCTDFAHEMSCNDGGQLCNSSNVGVIDTTVLQVAGELQHTPQVERVLDRERSGASEEFNLDVVSASPQFADFVRAGCVSDGSSIGNVPGCTDFAQDEIGRDGDMSVSDATKLHALQQQVCFRTEVALDQAINCEPIWAEGNVQPGIAACLPSWHNTRIGISSQADCELTGSDSLAFYARRSTPDDLFDAVTGGNLQHIRNVVANMTDINEFTSMGSHILFRAVMKVENLEILEFLFESGADVHATDVRGNSVMHFWARSTGSMMRLLRIGKMLVDRGADVNAQRSFDGVTPLHYVIGAQSKRKGWVCIEKAQFLIENGANVHARLDGTGERPIDLLSASSDSQSTLRVRRLLKFAETAFR